MATSGYVSEIQPAAPTQGAAVTITAGQPDTTSTPTPQFLAEIQTTVATPTIVTPADQAAAAEQSTVVTTQKAANGSQNQSAAPAPTAQTQYVTAEIQGSPTQSGNAQSTPQFIVVTVTGKLYILLQLLQSQMTCHCKSVVIFEAIRTNLFLKIK